MYLVTVNHLPNPAAGETRDHSLSLDTLLRMQECQAADHLWVCLICGSVFCGSRHEDHARGHYDSTLHAYSIEIGDDRGSTI